MVEFSKKIDYDLLVQKALLNVVKDAMKQVEDFGISSENCFYITFKTRARGVKLPDFLANQERFKDKMTIVIEKQFSNLVVSEKEFGVTLDFGGNPYYLVITFASIVEFHDTKANFSCGFDVPDIYGEDRFDPAFADEDENKVQIDYDANIADSDKGDKSDNVIELDIFKK